MQLYYYHMCLNCAVWTALCIELYCICFNAVLWRKVWSGTVCSNTERLSKLCSVILCAIYCSIMSAEKSEGTLPWEEVLHICQRSVSVLLITKT